VRRMRRQAMLVWVAVLAAVACLCLSAAWAQQNPPEETRKIGLKHADAVDLAIAFGAQPPRPRTPEQERALAATASGWRARQQERILAGTRLAPPGPGAGPVGPARYGPGQPPGVVANWRPAPRDGSFRGELEQFLPEGLVGPPAALERDNSLLVRGTPAAIDEFVETLALFDVPSRMVNIRADVLDAPVQVQRSYGVDLFARAGNADVGVITAPGDSNLSLRYRTGNFSGLLGALERESRGKVQLSPQVTTMNRSPAVLTVGQSIPFAQSVVRYDQFGNRFVDFFVDNVFVGVELFVLPRINGDDTVTMIIRPSVIDQTGQVVGPQGATYPITQQTLTETVVTIPDGQTMLIGGLPRVRTSGTDPFAAGPFPAGSFRMERSDLLIFVTPTIIRQREE
ncbi:MAG: type II secretion system protein GspD, partial [Armatimonadota bacterium]